MSFPPAFLDELRSRLPLSQVAGRKVIWDRRKSNPGKGDWWAPCPFHHEKTPSFHVEDNKGFYYCFGCQAKGDLISFVTETENVGFMEAVEILAREAGLTMPERSHDPRAAERRDRHARLYEAMEQAVRLFQLAYRASAGASARDYVAGRGLTDQTVARFELGYAPDSRTHLVEAFKAKGMLDEAVEAGLAIRPDGGGTPYDRFRGRLMFPIRDPRGRCIAFGGRALSPDAAAKYLNSPETPIFSKGRTLYNHAPAREAAGKAHALIVAEGYMDVIALAQGGFDHAVAPLGTAITADQLGLMWRIADEPIIALDGDAAGLRAADRLVDLALPMLAPGKSLRFCVLPEGQDPDDLLRSGGAPAMKRALEGAHPLIDRLWQRETAATPLDTPERRAACDARLRAAIATIADISVRSHYTAEVKTRRAELYRPVRPARPERAPRGPQGNQRQRRGQGQGRFAPPAGPQPGTRNSALVRQEAGDPRHAARIREAVILMIALRNPQALAPLEVALETLGITTPDLARLRDALLAGLAEDDPADPAAFHARLAARLGEDPVAMLERIPQARTHPLARTDRPQERVVEVLDEALRRHAAEIAWTAESETAARELGQAEGEEWTWRLRQAGDERQRLDLAEPEEAAAAEESGPSPLQAMLDAEIYKRRKS